MGIGWIVCQQLPGRDGSALFLGSCLSCIAWFTFRSFGLPAGCHVGKQSGGMDEFTAGTLQPVVLRAARENRQGRSAGSEIWRLDCLAVLGSGHRRPFTDRCGILPHAVRADFFVYGTRKTGALCCPMVWLFADTVRQPANALRYRPLRNPRRRVSPRRPRVPSFPH